MPTAIVSTMEQMRIMQRNEGTNLAGILLIASFACVLNYMLLFLSAQEQEPGPGDYKTLLHPEESSRVVVYPI